MRPMDLAGLDKEGVFDELEKLVVDMQGWLDCVGSSLDELLASPVGIGGEESP